MGCGFVRKASSICVLGDRVHVMTCLVMREPSSGFDRRLYIELGGAFLAATLSLISLRLQNEFDDGTPLCKSIFFSLALHCRQSSGRHVKRCLWIASAKRVGQRMKCGIDRMMLTVIYMLHPSFTVLSRESWFRSSKAHAPSAALRSVLYLSCGSHMLRALWPSSSCTR